MRPASLAFSRMETARPTRRSSSGRPVRGEGTSRDAGGPRVWDDPVTLLMTGIRSRTTPVEVAL
jgi:hypothetical protein